MEQMLKRNYSHPLFLATLLFFALYLGSHYNYLFFHSLAELFSIIIACGIFMVVWNSRQIIRNNYLLFIGTAYLFVGGLDLAHMLAYKGMAIFKGYETDLATQLWIAARYMESLSFLLAPLFFQRQINIKLILLGYSAAFVLLLTSIFYWEIFPVCFVEGTGLTPFKKISEYVISLILLSSIPLLLKNREEFDRTVLGWIIGSIVLTIVSELFFTFYISAYGLSNLFGHFFKILSFYFIYKAIIETGLKRPYALLFRDMKRSGEALRESEGLLRLFIEHAPASLAMFDREMRYLSASRRWLSDYGLGDQDLKGRSHYEIFPEIAERWKEAHRLGLAGQVVRAETDRFDRANGSVQWIRWEVRPWRDTAGRVAGIVIFTEDITERKRAEETLRLSEEKFAKAFATNPAAIAITGLRDGMIVEANDTWLSMFGYRRDEVIGRSTLSLQIWPTPGDRERFAEEVRKKGSLRDWEQRLLRRSGEPFVALGSGYILTVAGEDLFLSTWLDITERKRAEEALRKSEEEYRHLVQYAPTGIYEIGYEGPRFKRVNEAMCRILGYTEQELLKLNPLTLLDEQSKQKFVDRIRRGLAGEKIEESIEFLVRTKDGREIWTILNVKLTYKEGKLEGALVVAHDITERKRAEKALIQSEARFKLLSDTAWRLLASNNPQGIVNELCQEVMEHLGCQVFVNFLLDEVAGKLHLNACAGIPPEEARKIEWLDYGVAVCGCVARDGAPIVAENIFQTPDVRTELVKSYGIQAYACHPLKVGDRLIGTLSFGTKTRAIFSPEDLALMRTVTDQVATAMERIRLLKEVQGARDELERRVLDRTKELAKSQDRLRNLSSQLLLAQEKERKRVAVELHDGLLSELSGVKYLVESRTMLLENGKVPDLSDLKRISNILTATIKEARGIMNNLHPSVLDELGLIAAINWMSGEYQKSYPHIVVLKKIEVGERDIMDSLKVAIYRVLQEALNNFAKHGKGDRVELALLKSESTLTLKIQDNGQGFDVKTAQKGLGLESMRERVEISGGEFQIESAIGKGTAIRAIWSI